MASRLTQPEGRETQSQDARPRQPWGAVGMGGLQGTSLPPPRLPRRMQSACHAVRQDSTPEPFFQALRTWREPPLVSRKHFPGPLHHSRGPGVGSPYAVP